MSEEKMIRLSQAARQLNVATNTIFATLTQKGFKVENNPNAKITQDQFDMLAKEFKVSALEKKEASNLTIKKNSDNQLFDSGNNQEKNISKEQEEDFFVPVVKETAQSKKEEPVIEPIPEKIEIEIPKVQGLTVLGKIDLNPKKNIVEEKKPVIVEKTQPVEIKPIEPVVIEEKKVEEKKIEEKKPEIEPEIKIVQVEEKVEPIKEIIKPKEEIIKQEPIKEPIKVKENIVVKENNNVEEIPKPLEVAKIEVIVENKEEDVPIELLRAKGETLKGLTVLGKIELPKPKVGKVLTEDEKGDRKRKRKRKRLKVDKVPVTGGDANKTTTLANKTNTPGNNTNQGTNTPKTNTNTTSTGTNNNNANKRVGKKPFERQEVSAKQISDQIKQTLSKLNPSKGNNNRGKKGKGHRNREDAQLLEDENTKTLKVTEFISANDLSSLMNVSVNEVISTCLNLGMFVSINQRLDAEAITVIADEFGYEVEFTSAEDDIEVSVLEVDTTENLIDRAPIVTIMGHVDHGKTSLLDYIRRSKVAAGEAGGITQHIGAYDVTTDTNRKITFLDTPGHEAFTAMRARGAKVTDVVIIVVAADDNVMPQTKEAINHAQAAGVPIVIAINKIDKPGANPEKIRAELSEMNILVEEWGGKYQCQEISAKTGQGVSDLLEKVLLESDILELKANPNKKAIGTVIEASLDKGRGYVTTLLVQSGTLKVGDILLAGSHFGRVKAMMNHLGIRMKDAGPSIPVAILGLSGAPQAGDKFNVMETEREAREIANRREQILREQKFHTRRHTGLEEIGRRIALGNFSELNIIIKGDVDGSVEALADSLLKLSTPEVQVNIINKGVGQISESDVNLAIAADAIIIGFQVRPSLNARKLADQEEIDMRLYSIIYDAINQVKDAMEGLLAPTLEEIIVANVEVREVFKISKIGTVAGCYVLDGNLKRNNKVRLIRDGIVVHTGDIDALKRFKDDVSDVKFGYECGLSIKGLHDIEIGDLIESFEMKEVKRTL